ncbi:MAG: M18 family aminopeptidase [Catonella sp.]|nr:M18 family aminopeptidase [Catonella sp.]MDY6357267.1 M18 family aminopeptidase [Catonella sp.]
MQNVENADIKVSEDLLSFIKSSPSVFHVVKSFSEILDAAGFRELRETEKWSLEAGGSYYVTRNGSAIIAFTLPKDADHFQITAAHSDSPTFRLKDSPEIKKCDHYVELNVEKYGGAIISPWLDRPLSIAGRVIVESENGLAAKLVNIDRDLCLIPNLAIHMNRKVNEGYEYSVQNDMLPLFGDEDSEGRLSEIIAENAGVTKENIIASDLFLYNRVEGRIWGANNEYISSGKLDDLQCAYSCMMGLINSVDSEDRKITSSINVCSIFDNEEVGSGTKQGADSTFIYDTLKRINLTLGGDEEDFIRKISGSFMISADNAHAVHPLHADKADPVNRPFMNLGPVIKYSANQKYTTDAVSGAVFKRLCKIADVPCQTFFNHSDLPGGSTLGNISTKHLSMNTVDIGLAELAMHSPYETAGVKDTGYLIKVAETFYRSDVRCDGKEIVIR